MGDKSCSLVSVQTPITLLTTYNALGYQIADKVWIYIFLATKYMKYPGINIPLNLDFNSYDSYY